MLNKAKIFILLISFLVFCIGNYNINESRSQVISSDEVSELERIIEPSRILKTSQFNVLNSEGIKGSLQGSDTNDPCPEGYSLSEASGKCEVLKQTNDPCPEGYSLSQTSGKCEETGKQTSNIENFIKYSNPQLGFSVNYPEGAQIQESNNSVMFFIKPNIQVLIGIYDFNGIELNEFKVKFLENMKQQSSFTLIDSFDEILAGYPSYVIQYFWDSTQGGKFTSISELTVVGDKAYEINIDGNVNIGDIHIDSLLSIFEKIHSSFTIIKTGSLSNQDQQQQE